MENDAVFRYFSMFSGIGGFELGISRACDNWEQLEQGSCSKESSIGIEVTESEQPKKRWNNTCVGFSEIDKYAIKIYESHFGGQDAEIRQVQQVSEQSKDSGFSESNWSRPKHPDIRKGHKNYGDATLIDPQSLPDFDLLVGGFPCQAFSIAGKRLGFEDTRGTLFFDIARILKVKRPRMFLLENVKGLLSHDNGRTFKTIITTLAELGYGVEWQVLNSKDFGVPQNRERVFIVGHLGEFGGREVFPIGETNPVSLNYRGAIMSEQNKKWLEDGKQLSRNFPQGQRVYGSDGLGSCIASQAGGLGAKTGLYAIPVLTPDRPNKRQNGRRFKEDGEPAFTCTAQDKHGVFDGMRIRRLTPTECERLQGYPDGWTAGVSDSQRYKTLGNSVTVNVIEAIMLNIFNGGNRGK